MGDQKAALPIVLSQRPIIEYSFKSIKERIGEITSLVESAIDGDGTLKDLKDLRAILNKEFETLELARTGLKTEYMKPFEEFQTEYKDQVTQEVNSALTKLATKIKEAEQVILDGKIKTLKDYFVEYSISIDVTEIRYDQLGIKVTASADLGPIKKQIRERLDKISSELLAISTMQYSEEVYAEYTQLLDLPAAIAKVNQSIELARRALEREAEEKARREAESARQAEARTKQEPVRVPTPEPKVETPAKAEIAAVETYVLTLTTTEEKMVRLMEFLEREGIIYE